MVFVSYSSKDTDVVNKYLKVFRDNGIDYWFGPDEIEPSEFYCEEITGALRTCEIVVSFCSKSAMKSIHVMKELDIALKFKKSIIPVFLEEVTLTDPFLYLYSGCQRVILYSKKGVSKKAELNKLTERLKSGSDMFEIPIGYNSGRSFEIMKGSYCYNIERMHENDILRNMIPNTAFVTGFDRTATLISSSDGGVLKSMLPWLKDTYGVSLQDFQCLIDEAIEREGLVRDADGLFECGAIVPVVIENRNNDSKFLPINLYMVMNSVNLKPGENEDDELLGADSREIILKVFNRIAMDYNKSSQKDDAIKNIFLPAIGTRKLYFPYEIITTEIINAFLFAVKKDFAPFNVFFSVQKEDMERCGTTTASIYRYISSALNLSNKQ